MKNFLNSHIVHGIVSAILVAVPFVIINEPAIANLTVGAILNMGLSWLKANTA